MKRLSVPWPTLERLREWLVMGVMALAGIGNAMPVILLIAASFGLTILLVVLLIDEFGASLLWRAPLVLGGLVGMVLLVGALFNLYEWGRDQWRKP